MTVQRKIYFYRINVGSTDAGEPILFNPSPVLQEMEGLPFDVDGRYWEYDESPMPLGRQGLYTSW